MTLGSMITQARKSAGLSIDDLSASTNIRASLLREMESDSFHNCGGETYARGHIRNIATKLGVDPLIFIAAFEEEQMHTDRSMKDLLVENSVMRLPESARKVSWKVLATISVASLFVVGLAQIIISNTSSVDIPAPIASTTESATPSAEATPTEEATVSTVDVQNGRAKAVITEDGQRIECDAVILNPDLPVAWRDLLGKTPLNVKRLNYSPSCVTMLAGSSKEYDFAAHHNIHFGESWDGVFDELIKKKQLMSDPSVLVTIPSLDDPSLAPAGKTSYYVLFPTPNLTADIDWTQQTKPYRDHMVETLEQRGYTGFGDAIETEVITTPLDWKNQGMEEGAPFASAHTFFQTGPFRPRNLAAGFENVAFAGSGTQPGVGVPMVLISGRLAAERIVGPVK